MQSNWVAGTEAAIRDIVDDLVVSEADEFRTLIRRGLDRIDPSPDQFHAAILRLLLLDLCGTVLRTIHARQPSGACVCHAAAWDHAHTLLVQSRDTDARVEFERCVDRIISDSASAHRPTSARVAAAMIRADPARAWTLGELATSINIRPRRLSREFQKLFGFRASEYVHLVRVSRAVAALRTATKVDVMARDAGYRSKKDFYAALKRWVGLTPTDVRALPHDESTWLARTLRRRCLEPAAGEEYPPINSHDRQVAAFVAYGPTDTPACRQQRRHHQ